MDEFLAMVGVQAMRFAIRSSIAVTSSYALDQCARLLRKSVDEKNLYLELRALQKLLDSKIKVISPAIDLVEFKSGRGNVFLESALPLTKSLHRQVISLGRRIEAIVDYAEDSDEADVSTAKQGDTHHKLLRQVIADIKSLLDRIDREIPLLQLAITASGESLSTSLPATISPSRLLQASTLLIVGDTQYAQDPTRSVQIGPAFHLSLYMLFLGHASHESRTQGQNPVYGLGETERKPLWQEVAHKTRVRLCRSAQKQQSNGTGPGELTSSGSNAAGSPHYAYHLEIIEDLDDGRLHDEPNAAAPYEGIPKAGIRESIPIHQLSKIFYTVTGRMLNLGNAADGESSPVLLIKRDLNAPRLSQSSDGLRQCLLDDMEEESSDCVQDRGNDEAKIDPQLREGVHSANPVTLEERLGRACNPSMLPKHLDPEWIAFEVYESDEEEADNSDTEVGSESGHEDLGSQVQEPKAKGPVSGASLDSKLAVQIRNLSLQPSFGSGGPTTCRQSSTEAVEMDEADALDFVARSPFGAIASSLSLIEMLIRLAGLQEVQQRSHLSTPDHILTFFLEETSTMVRDEVRSEAERRVGFDPYADLPPE